MDFLLPEPAPPADTYQWATVTQVDPPRIRLDAEDVPLEAEPEALCPLHLGGRVWVQFHGRMMIILGIKQQPTA